MQLRFQTAVRAEDSPAQKWPETSCAVHTNLISSKCHGGSRCSHWLWYQALQICGSGRMEVERSFFFLNLGSVYVGHNGCWPWGRVDTGPWNPIPCMSDTVKASASSFNISQYTSHTRFSSFFTSSHPPVHSLLYLITSSSMPIYSQSPSPITSLLFHHFPPSHFPLICLPIRASLHSSPKFFFFLSFSLTFISPTSSCLYLSIIDDSIHKCVLIGWTPRSKVTVGKD